MSSTVKLREQRERAWNAMKEINDRADDEGRAPTGEELEAYARAEAKFDELDAEIDRVERFANRKAGLETVDRSGAVHPGPVEGPSDDERLEVFDRAFEGFIRNGFGSLDAEERRVLRSQAMDPKEIKNAAGIGTTTAGGYLVPPGFRKQLIETMKAYGSVESVCQVIDTGSGAPLQWPTNNDTGNLGAILAENTASAEQDFVFGTATLGAYKYTSKLVRLSIEFLQDVDWIDAQGFLQRKLGERLARIHNQHRTTGTGTAQPQGIVTGATTGVTAASTTVVTADELIDLQHSIDPAYRNERSKYMLSDTVLKNVRKLKDSQNRYLFQTAVSADMPSQIAGQQYVVNQDMAVPATGVKSILYGDFYTGYVVRRVNSFELIRLEERFAEFGQVAFIGFDREDAVVQDANAFKALAQA